MENIEFIKELKSKRIDYGVTQRTLADRAGITRQYLNEIENGKSIASKDVKEALRQSLEQLNPDNPLEFMFDYVRIRFPTTDVKYITENILRIKLKFMWHEDYAFYSYEKQYMVGNVVVMYSSDEKMGTLLELKGKGCRQFEGYLSAQKRSWLDFFKDVLEVGGIFKRLDIAINDKYGLLDILDLIEKCKNDECISVFRSFKDYGSGELVKTREESKSSMGRTLYIGSLKSEVYFCIYQKAYEQYVKCNIPIEEAEVKNRFEIRLKSERATHAVYDYISHNDIGHTAFSIINRYVSFIDIKENKQRRSCPVNKSWAWFIGMEDRKLKLTTKPEPYTFEKTINWINRQVAPSLKTLKILDDINNTDMLTDIVANARLSERHEILLEQLTISAMDIIV